MHNVGYHDQRQWSCTPVYESTEVNVYCTGGKHFAAEVSEIWSLLSPHMARGFPMQKYSKQASITPIL